MVESKNRRGVGNGAEYSPRGRFLAVKEFDPQLGFEVARLSLENSDPRKNISAVAWPVGASLGSLTFGDVPIIQSDKGEFIKRGKAPGWCRPYWQFILPNRHRGSTEIDGTDRYLEYKGDKYFFDKFPPHTDGNPDLINGIQFNQQGEMQDPVVRGDSASVTTILPWDRSQELFDIFPFPYEAAVTTSITGRGLQNVVAITNTGDKTMPVAAADHLYYEMHEGSKLCVPANGLWLPTGELASILPEHPELDFNKPRLVKGLKLDQGYLRALGKNPFILHPNEGIRVDMIGPERNKFVQVFRFGDSKFVCAESMPVPNWLNLYAQAERDGNADLMSLTRPNEIEPGRKASYRWDINLSRI